ncbi:MAG: hypothetical protein JO101_03825 [Candidatus Eremiobacteraeota bacterium]|nr:hypothetical protein [Candidatus Eremiobacteraeota bacterium]
MRRPASATAGSAAASPTTSRLTPMPVLSKLGILDALKDRFGTQKKLSGSESLFIVGQDAARIYFRYSKMHSGGKTFFGLRQVDLQQLEGHNAYLCLLTDQDSAPLFIPYADFEEVFHSAKPASDGQYKVQLLTRGDARELYIARQGRFNVEGYVGIEALERVMDPTRLRHAQALTHPQVQTLLAGIGHAKGHDVHIPATDISGLDWTLTQRFPLRTSLPPGFEGAKVLGDIDVVWIAAGKNNIEGLYEVEHSTPVYSGLLRFNDVLLTNSSISRFAIVSNDNRRELFARQVYRPTFRRSGLSDLCSFLEYVNVLDWHDRVVHRGINAQT